MSGAFLNPYERDRNGATPLHYAKTPADVDALLDAMPDDKTRFEQINTWDKTGRRPLEWAIWNLNVDVVEKLLDRGAIPIVVNVAARDEYLKDLITPERYNDLANKERIDKIRALLEKRSAEYLQNQDRKFSEKAAQYKDIHALLAGEPDAKVIHPEQPKREDFTDVPTLPAVERKGPPMTLLVVEGGADDDLGHHRETTYIANGVLQKLSDGKAPADAVLGVRGAINFARHGGFSQEENYKETQALAILMRHPEISNGTAVISNSEGMHTKDWYAFHPNPELRDAWAKMNPIIFNSTGNDSPAGDGSENRSGRQEQDALEYAHVPRVVRVGAVKDSSRTGITDNKGQMHRAHYAPEFYSEPGATFSAPLLNYKGENLLGTSITTP
ncbi:MAG: hypothetical protein JO089_08315, partial [Alphaproteobacteria bacterium]|nr:hypothetical protein [Alphaproteobacteria bacterium]